VDLPAHGLVGGLFIGGGAGHCATCLGALFARIGTLVAMFVVVLAAFLTAGIAYVSTQLANPLGKLRSTGHFAHGEGANVGTAAVEFDAAGHHLHVVLLQAGSCAVFTGFHALVTSLDTFFVFFV
jgi:hypothetical protein